MASHGLTLNGRLPSLAAKPHSSQRQRLYQDLVEAANQHNIRRYRIAIDVAVGDKARSQLPRIHQARTNPHLVAAHEFALVQQILA
jgi:hypothetical protein